MKDNLLIIKFLIDFLFLFHRVPHRITSSSSINGNGNQERPLVNNDRLIIKRMECISGLPGGDCENSFLGGESLGQDFLRPGGRNPGK